MRKRTHLMIFILIVMCLVLAACDTDIQSLSTGGGGLAAVLITSPEDGSSVQPGQFVVIEVDVLVPGGASAVLFEVNEVIERNEPFHRTFEKGNLEIPWQPEEEGEYRLRVILQSTGGDLFESNLVTVWVGGQPAAPAEEQQPAEVSETPVPTVTGTVTVTVTPTPTITPTPTLGIAMATAQQNINCRYGPGEVYTITSGLHSDETVPITGRNKNDSWWQVQDPYSSAKCWVLAELVVTSGDLSKVPFVAAPPTPTPTFTNTPTFTPTATFTEVTIGAPQLISPSGSLKCVRRIVLKWNAVSHPDGISQYEWQLESVKTGTVSGTTTDIFAPVDTTCGLAYTWRVRAYDMSGNAGPFSSDMQFTLE